MLVFSLTFRTVLAKAMSFWITDRRPFGDSFAASLVKSDRFDIRMEFVY